jgi:large subunit ribosomal protein L3
MKFILGKKLGMTQLWRGEEVVAVTKVQAGPCVVTQAKEQEKDGYAAVQLGFEQKKSKNIKKPQKGHLNKLKNAGRALKTDFRYLKEFRLNSGEKENGELAVGDIIIADTFESGDKVSITGRSKGRGFQGVVKKYNFSGAMKTHGIKDQERMPGSAGAMGVGKIFKGKKMPGRMGGKTVTTSNLEVVDIDTENNIIYIKGAVAGSRNDLILLQGKGELNKKTPEEVPSVLEEGDRKEQGPRTGEEVSKDEQVAAQGEQEQTETGEGAPEQEGEQQEVQEQEQQEEDKEEKSNS